MVADLLFYRGDLRGTLENIKAKLAHEIAKAPDDHVLEADEEAWAGALAERYRVEAPTLRRDEMWQDESLQSTWTSRTTLPARSSPASAR